MSLGVINEAINAYKKAVLIDETKTIAWANLSFLY